MWVRLLIRWLITSIAVAAAVLLVPGFYTYGPNPLYAIVITAAILGLANAVIRPILAFLSCGCIVATLGLFMLVVNAATLWVAVWVSANWFRAGIGVDSGFWPFFWASIVISIVSFFLSVFLPDEQQES
jgi:putative membrane protein